MSHPRARPATGEGQRDIREQGAFVLSGLTASHAVFHFIPQSFSVMLPAIRESLGITPVEIGALITAREMASGIASLPGGVLSDRLRRYWGLVFAVCMAGFGAGWLLMGLSPLYPVLMLGMVVLSVAGSIWHLPAMAVISERFELRRGSALAIHGVGGNVGDVIGPLVTGLLLGFIVWQHVLSIYAAVPLVLAVVTVWGFRNVGRRRPPARGVPAGDVPSMDFRTQMDATRDVLKSVALWRVNLVAGLRGMCYAVYTTFLPLYMAEELNLSSKSVGFHLALLFSIGILVSPVMGYLSDRFGRKVVLVPTLAGSCILSALLPAFGHGAMLTVLIALLGLFLRSDYPLLAAMTLDLAGDKVATTVLGTLSFTRFALAAVSPLIAGAIYQTLGMQATLYYLAALFGLAALNLLTTNLKPVSTTRAAA